jgi:hypothetical protein
MPRKGDIYLGALGSEELVSAFGRVLTINPVEIARSQRTASGKLVKEVIAEKKQFTLAYSVIDGTDLQQFIDFYDLDSELSLLIYTRDELTPTTSTTTTSAPGTFYDAYTVLMQPIDRTRLLLLDTGLWGNVNIVLEEV